MLDPGHFLEVRSIFVKRFPGSPIRPDVRYRVLSKQVLYGGQGRGLQSPPVWLPCLVGDHQQFAIIVNAVSLESD